jgi:hypothetical protein
LVPAPDGGADAFGIGVLFGDEAVDSGLEIDQRMEDAALEAPTG